CTGEACTGDPPTPAPTTSSPNHLHRRPLHRRLLHRRPPNPSSNDFIAQASPPATIAPATPQPSSNDFIAQASPTTPFSGDLALQLQRHQVLKMSECVKEMEAMTDRTNGHTLKRKANEVSRRRTSLKIHSPPPTMAPIIVPGSPNGKYKYIDEVVDDDVIEDEYEDFDDDEEDVDDDFEDDDEVDDYVSDDDMILPDSEFVLPPPEFANALNTFSPQSLDRRWSYGISGKVSQSCW
ncbi:hypothetical protein LINGRAHAP2_LOCUS22138, partial [Linum grandiflorum]